MKVRVAGSEGERLEFKSANKGRLPENIWTTISAFSNTNGGMIVFGVDDDGFEVGLTEKDMDKIQKDFVSLCNTGFNHRILPTISVEDNHILAVIDPLIANMRPLFSKNRGIKNGTYIRVGSTDIKATDEDILCFAAAAQGGAETFTYETSTYDALDHRKIHQYIELLNSKNSDVYQRFTFEEILAKQKILIDNRVSLFGLLAFSDGLSLQEIVSPAINIAVTQYPEADKVSPDANFTYLDSREFNGSVIDQFENAFAFIKNKLPVRGMVGADGKRQDYLVIPDIAIREALANAIVHRDYAALGSRIQIDIYANRIEITNPGRSLMPIEDLEITQSITRNPLTMNFFKENGYTEQKARGIRTIMQTTREAGLKTPIFENVAGHSFKVTLFTSAFLPDEDREWLKKYRDYDLRERQLNCLAFLRHKNDEGINNSEYRALNNMNSVGDDKMANRELMNMVKMGILRSEGDAKYRRYYLPK